MGTASDEVVVVVAAMKREFDGLRRHCGSWLPLAWPVDFAAKVMVAGRAWVLAANGPGPRLATEVLETAAARVSAVAAVSTGFAGGLDPALARGTVVVAREVVDWESDERFPAAPPAAAGVSGLVVSGDRIVTTSREKAALRQRFHASCVDMEAAAVARWACQRRLPFHCIKVISDTAAESFAIDWNALRDADGRMPLSRILSHAVAHPSTRIPELIQLARSSRRASVALGDFLASCRF
jgi:adenosylhomocysteine nucleosidase